VKKGWIWGRRQGMWLAVLYSEQTEEQLSKQYSFFLVTGMKEI